MSQNYGYITNTGYVIKIHLYKNYIFHKASQAKAYQCYCPKTSQSSLGRAKVRRLWLQQAFFARGNQMVPLKLVRGLQYAYLICHCMMDAWKIKNKKREFIEVVQMQDKRVCFGSLELIDIWGLLKIIFLISSLLFKIHWA